MDQKCCFNEPVRQVERDRGRGRMKREEILESARKYVCGDREQEYGSPENNFQTIAYLWSTYIRAKKPHLKDWALNELEAPDVAAMLALLKIARIASGHAKTDNWVDLAGYAACGGELELKEAMLDESQT